jgi:DNA-binding transcriptional regulator YdaS (Cro superfamily)
MLMFTPIQRAIRVAGSQRALAARCGVTQAAVSKWVLGGRVPAERCVEIERATSGAVRCEELRPDIEWAVLRRAAPPALPAPQDRVA